MSRKNGCAHPDRASPSPSPSRTARPSGRRSVSSGGTLEGTKLVMKKNVSPSPRVGPLPVWGIGLAVVVAGTAALLVRNRNDLVSTGLGLVVLQGLLLWLGTLRVRYLTLAMLAASWVFAATVAMASAFELHSW